MLTFDLNATGHVAVAANPENVKVKARLLGVLVSYVDPRNTSKTCSKCRLIGKHENKSFKCPNCGRVDSADVNAAFNIGMDISDVY